VADKSVISHRGGEASDPLFQGPRGGV
jgi:hypothetical protein